MFRRLLIAIIVMTLQVTVSADTLEIKKVRHAGPFRAVSPVVLDSVDNAQKKYAERKPLDMRLPLSLVENKPFVDVAALALDSSDVHIVAFDVMAAKYLKDIKVGIKGCKDYKVFADGKEQSGAISLQPGYHSISVKFVADSTAIVLSVPEDGLALLEDGMRRFSMSDVLGTKVTTRASLSASGRWAFVAYRWYDAENKVVSEQWLTDLKTGEKRILNGEATWMPNSDTYYFTEKVGGKKSLKVVDPLTGSITVLAKDFPDEWFVISPTEKYAVISPKTEGTKKEDGVFEIVHPDDRQPGWRTRYSLSRMDLKTGFVQPLTYTYRGVYVSDISADGQHILLSVSSDSLTQRPTTRQSFYDLDLKTLTMKQLVDKDGFINGAIWADGNSKVVFKASTEAFGGIGNRVPEGSTPNMYDLHMYVLDCQSGTVTPTTADDATSIEDMEYSPSERAVYYTAQNADSVSLYRMDLASLTSVRIGQPLEVLTGLSVASKGGNIVVRGSSACTPYKVLAIDKPASKRPTISTVLAPNDEMYASIELGTAHPWSFQCNRGYTVTGFYYLPANFDPAKKYPVVLYVYGGPHSQMVQNTWLGQVRMWEMLMAQKGYIVYVQDNRGTQNRGAEYEKAIHRHCGQNEMADQMVGINMLKSLPFVDSDRIGVHGWSYGGFMTISLMTNYPETFKVGVAGGPVIDWKWYEIMYGERYMETEATNPDGFAQTSLIGKVDGLKGKLLICQGAIDNTVVWEHSLSFVQKCVENNVQLDYFPYPCSEHNVFGKWRIHLMDKVTNYFDDYLK